MTALSSCCSATIHEPCSEGVGMCLACFEMSDAVNPECEVA